MILLECFWVSDYLNVHDRPCWRQEKAPCPKYCHLDFKLHFTCKMKQSSCYHLADLGILGLGPSNSSPTSCLNNTNSVLCIFDYVETS